MNTSGLDDAQHVLVKVQRQARMQPALKEDLRTAQLLRLFYLLKQLLLAQNTTLWIVRCLKEGAKLAGGDADVSLVDVPINDVGDNALWMEPSAHRISKEAELVQVSLCGETEEVCPAEAFSGKDLVGDCVYSHGIS